MAGNTTPSELKVPAEIRKNSRLSARNGTQAGSGLDGMARSPARAGDQAAAVASSGLRAAAAGGARIAVQARR